jgi:hypothetical protein
MISPLEIKAYECPVCGYLTKDKGYAEKHAQIPPRNDLPKGLVLGWGTAVQRGFPKVDAKIKLLGSYTVVVGNLFYEKHIANPILADITTDGTPSQLGVGPRPSSDIKQGIDANCLQVLTQKEFEAFLQKHQSDLAAIQKKYQIEGFIRTSPKLDDLIVVEDPLHH